MYSLKFDDNVDLSVINYCLIGAQLTDEQLVSVKKAVDIEKSIWQVEMGLGKTYMVVGFVNHLLPYWRENGYKCILVAPTNKLIDFVNVLTQHTSAKVLLSTGDKNQLEVLMRDWDYYDVFIVTQSAWTISMDFNIWVFNHKKVINTCIYDEAQGINDVGYMHFLELCKKRAKYVALLNATPVGSTSSFVTERDKLRVVHNLLYAVCEDVDKNYDKFYFKNTYNIETNSMNPQKRVLNIDKYKDAYGKYFISSNRQDLGINTIYKSCIFHRCILSAQQTSIVNDSKLFNSTDINILLYSPETSDLFQLTTSSVPALGELINIIQSYDEYSNKIVYVKNHSSISTIYEYLKALGYNVFILDGQHTQTHKEKNVVEDLFNNTRGGIMITSIDRGSNLSSASHIIIYDTPPDTLQFVARAIRGFNSKEITLDWIYYPEYERDKMLAMYEMIITISEMTDRDIGVLPFLESELKCMYPNARILKLLNV